MHAALVGFLVADAFGGSTANTGQPVFVHRKIGLEPCELVQSGSLVTTKEFAWVEIEGEKSELYSPEMGPGDYLSASPPISGHAAKDAHKSGFELKRDGPVVGDVPMVHALQGNADCADVQTAIAEVERSRALRRSELQARIYRPGTDDIAAARVLKELVPNHDQDTTPNTPTGGTGAKHSANFDGTVVLSVLIGIDGTVKQTKVVRSANPEIGKKAAQAVSRWKFIPARKKGLPVPSVMPVEINFHL
jgi:protein TonB